MESFKQKGNQTKKKTQLFCKYLLKRSRISSPLREGVNLNVKQTNECTHRMSNWKNNKTWYLSTNALCPLCHGSNG